MQRLSIQQLRVANSNHSPNKKLGFLVLLGTTNGKSGGETSMPRAPTGVWVQTKVEDRHSGLAIDYSNRQQHNAVP
jgi:hypothetical protein